MTVAVKPYKHIVQYYETDKMGITHHSNYIRWMEEARTDFLEQIGWGYRKLESLGVISPVTSIECKYKTSTTYSDVITIKVKVAEFKGVRLKVEYVMIKEDGNVAFEAHSEHCFLDEEGCVIRLKNRFPELHDILTECSENAK